MCFLLKKKKKKKKASKTPNSPEEGGRGGGDSRPPTPLSGGLHFMFYMLGFCEGFELKHKIPHAKKEPLNDLMALPALSRPRHIRLAQQREVARASSEAPKPCPRSLAHYSQKGAAAQMPPADSGPRPATQTYSGIKRTGVPTSHRAGDH